MLYFGFFFFNLKYLHINLTWACLLLNTLFCFFFLSFDDEEERLLCLKMTLMMYNSVVYLCYFYDLWPAS